MKQPEIRINFSELLYGNVSPGIAKDMGEELPSTDECYEWVANYRIEWAKYEQKLVEGMTKALGISFYKPVIDVAVAPFFIPQSSPIIMNFRNYPDQFVDVLAHELLHVLLTDNNKTSIYDESPALNLIEEWHALFGTDYGFDTLVHIPVQAVLKYLYLDVLKDRRRFERDVKESSEFDNSLSYVNSWKYVNDNDYKIIIKQLKKSYASIG